MKIKIHSVTKGGARHGEIVHSFRHLLNILKSYGRSIRGVSFVSKYKRRTVKQS